MFARRSRFAVPASPCLAAKSTPLAVALLIALAAQQQSARAEDVGPDEIQPCPADNHCLPPDDTAAPAVAIDRDPYASVLAEQAIRADGDGPLGYLRQVLPTEGNKRRIALLIQRLGSSDYEARELAERQLVALPGVSTEVLRAAAADSPDAEVRSRAENVIAARGVGNASAAVAVACFRTIARTKPDGAAPVVLAAMPLYAEEFVLVAGRDAARATATRADLPALRKLAAAGHVEARVAAVGAMAAVLAGRCEAELRPLMTDAEPRVRLAAARALADCGNRACLPTLVDLLACADLRVRNASAATLRALTGRAGDYVAWAEPAARASSVRAWRAWLTSNGTTCALKYPLKAADAEFGRTLVCLYARNEVVEFDASGRETFSVTEDGGCPWACQGLPTGGRLVALYSTNTVVEYGPDGKARTRIPVPGGPMSVQRLDSGNTLVACNNAQKVVEVTDSGKIAWEVSLAGGPCDATRLDNGHTLVTLQNSNSVVEVDQAGKEVWRVDNLHTPRSASRLDNGNTLVCDLGTGKVMEFDAGGREVWSQGGFSSPFSAQRLSSGTTLVSDTVSVKEIDGGGRVVNENRVQPLGRVWRY